MSNIVSNYDHWMHLRDSHMKEYPVHPFHSRIDIELSNPIYDARLLKSCCCNSANGFFSFTDLQVCSTCLNRYRGFDSDHLQYFNSDWSVIFNVYVIEDSPHNSLTLRMLVEKGHQKPLGEKILFMSYEPYIDRCECTPFYNYNCLIDFAFFRNSYWNVTWNQTFSFF